MPSRRSPTLSFGCLLILFTGVALLGLVGVVILVSIPTQVAATYGPPSPHLGQGQRILLTFQLWQQGQALTTPHNPAGSQQVFRVDLGESIPTIARNLQQQGLITSAEAFRIYLIYRGLDVSLQAGEYHLTPAMTTVEIALAMQDATPGTVAFSILAGWRVEEIAAALPTSGLRIVPEDFLQLVKKLPRGYPINPTLLPGSSAEGYLAAGTYELARTTTAEELVYNLLAAFDSNVSSELRQGFAKQGLSLHEGVILASIIEREAIQDDEMSTIASVLYNRLAAGMNLATDPTVQYALGYNPTQSTWWTNPLSLAHLEVDSPYNTYRNPGLPPGPICNPSLAALQAAADPAETPYYYFRAACDRPGRHNFAISFEEHQANACP